MSDFTIRLTDNRSITIHENLVDRAVRFVDPVRGARRLRARAAVALAGSYVGASRTRRSLKEWTLFSSDPDTTILYELDDLRARSRDPVRNNPLAGGAINTAVTNIVGTGLKLNARIDRSIVSLTEERADELEQLIEAEWSLFWDTRDVDVERTNNGDAIGSLSLRQVLENGWCKRARRPTEEREA